MIYYRTRYLFWPRIASRTCFAAVFLFLISFPALLAQDLELFEDRVTEFTLENGLHFIIIERDVAPVASFVTFADVGSVNEPVNLTGIAHLFEHMVFKGSREVGTTDWEREQELIRKMDEAYQLWLQESRKTDPDENRVRDLWNTFEQYQEAAAEYVVNNEFSRIVELEGGTGLNAFTSADATGYFYSLPQNKAELWFSLESDRFKNPVFREFYQEKEVVLEERRMRTDSNPVGRLLEEFTSVAFSAHPYRNPVIGWPSDIQTTTIRDTREFYETFYTPENLTVAIAGDVDPQQMRELAELYFGDIPAADPSPPVNTIEPEKRGERRFIIEEETQPLWIAGYHTVDQMHEDWPALQILDTILAEGRTSRFHRRLVVGDQLAVEISAFNGFPGKKYDSMFVIFAVPNRDVPLNDLESAIEEELEKVQTGEITKEELDRAITKARGNLIRSLNSNMGMALELAEKHAQQGDWRRVFTYLDDLERVQLEDLERVARKYLIRSNRTVGKTIQPAAGEKSPN